MNAPHRRLACPGLADPMPTGDGLLARLVPSGRTIGLDAFAKLCAAAHRHGNGIVEITARGSIQVRGLRPDAAFAADVDALAIATNGIPVVVDPLAGIEANAAIDAGALADTLRTRLAPLTPQLGPKVSVIVDAGGALHLDRLAADVRLRLDPQDQRAFLSIGGGAANATPIGAVPLADVGESAHRALQILAQRGRDARARDLVRAQGPEMLRASLGITGSRGTPPPRPPSEPIGMHPLRDGTVALGIGLAFGHTDTHALKALIEASKASGANGVRTAHRALLVIGLSTEGAAHVAAIAEALGFLTRANDTRRYIAACAGAPICASAQIASRTLAPAIAKAAAHLLDGSFVLHLSGCAKGCAHPARSALTIVGRDGRCDLVVDGSAAHAPIGRVAAEALPARLAAIANDVVRSRRCGESVADVLTRLRVAPAVEALSGADHD
jgi:precorrin-3B synthase